MTHTLAGGAGGTAGFSVEDDPAEGTAVSDLGGDRIFDTVHNWVDCCTDGFAIGSLDTSFTFFAAFDLLPTGITSWQATSSSFAGIALALDMDRLVRFDVVPIPAALPLLASALGALGFFGWRRRKVSAA